MPTKTTPAVERDVYVPKDGGFVADVDGSPVNFHENLRVSKAWLDEHPEIAHLFRVITVHYDVEQTTSAPGETRG